MSEKHAFFFGFDPDLEVWRSNQRFIEARIKGNYRVRCGHCGVSLCGVLGHPGPVVEILWKLEGDSMFGTFTLAPTALTSGSRP